MSDPPRPESPAFLVRLYASLLVLLPSEFRREYGDQMVQFLEERQCEVGGQSNQVGLLAELFWDLFMTALTEHFKSFVRELKFAWRGLVRDPVFTFIAAFTLALGIGASVAVYSVVDAVMLRPLPFARPDALVQLWQSNASQQLDRSPVSAPDYLEWDREATSFVALAAYQYSVMTLTGAGGPQRLVGAAVTADLFRLLEAKPLKGRTFDESEVRQNTPVIILSRAFALQRFGSDAVLGKDLILNRKRFTVIGVMDDGFAFPIDPVKMNFWVPLTFAPADMDRSARYSNVVARLKEGTSIEVARSEMGAIASRLGEHPKTNGGWEVQVTPLAEAVTGKSKPTLLVLCAAVAMVLLITCVNVTNLLLARASLRRREMAIRGALGAGRQIGRQLLVEGALLSLIGGGTGTLLAFSIVAAIKVFGPENVPRLSEAGMDGRVLAFALCLSVATGILFGLVPAREATKVDLVEALRDGSRTAVGGSGRAQVRRVLVAVEIALASMLLVGTGQFVRSFIALQNVRPGFEPKNVLAMQVVLPQPKYGAPGAQAAFFTRVLEGVRELPGVESVAAITTLPLARSNLVFEFDVPGRPNAPAERPLANYRAVSPEYFRTMRIPILEGRVLDERDSASNRRVAVVNQTFAQRFFASGSSLGRSVRLFGYEDGGRPSQVWIVGVVGDVKHAGLEAESGPEIYMPYMQTPWPYMNLVVRTATEPTALAGSVRQQVLLVDPEQPVANVRTMEQAIAESMAPRRLSTLLLGAFGTVAFALAVIGIYGLVSYWVVQRTREIGVRMALGAQHTDIVKLILGQTLRLTAIGTAVGLLGSWVLSRVIGSMLFGVSATDPVAFGLPVLLGATALAAAYLPARKAARLDPLVALRQD